MDTAKIVVAGNRVHRPLMDTTVLDEDRELAEIELSETRDTRKIALELLKQLIDEQSDFTARTDDAYLLRFLRVRKFDVAKAFTLLKEHYRYRALHPDIFPLPSQLEKALRTGIFNYLPHRDHLGRAIYVGKMENWNTSEVSYNEFVAVGNMVSEYVLDNPVTQINGYTAIWDFKGFSLKQFALFCSPKNVIILNHMIQDRFPGRFKIAYCVNCPRLFQSMWNLVKSLLKDKFKQRVVIISSLKELHQVFDPSILPKEYGGMMPPSDATEIVKKCLANEPYFKSNRKYGFDPNDYHTLHNA